MKRFIFVIVIVIFAMCGSSSSLYHIDKKKINDIVIVKVKTGEKFEIKNQLIIDRIFQIISYAKKEPYIFKANYRIEFNYDKKDFFILVTENLLKFEGKSYLLKDDLENYIDSVVRKE